MRNSILILVASFGTFFVGSAHALADDSAAPVALPGDHGDGDSLITPTNCIATAVVGAFIAGCVYMGAQLVGQSQRKAAYLAKKAAKAASGRGPKQPAYQGYADAFLKAMKTAGGPDAAKHFHDEEMGKICKTAGLMMQGLQAQLVQDGWKLAVETWNKDHGSHCSDAQ